MSGTAKNILEKTKHKYSRKKQQDAFNIDASKTALEDREVVTSNTMEGQQLDLFPLAVETLRPELNIAKYSNYIFASPKDTDLAELRIFRLGIEDVNETEIQVSPVTFSYRKVKYTRVPTHTSENYLYALFQLWDENGRPSRNEGLNVWGSDIFKILGIAAGGTSYDSLHRELRVLSGCLVHLDNFIDGTEIPDAGRDFKLLDSVSFRTQRNRVTRKISNVSFQIKFSDDILVNLQNNITKPLLFKTLLSIKSHHGRRLYKSLDLYLNHKNPIRNYAASSLVSNYKIPGKKYSEKKHRKQLLLKFITDLNGLPVSRGRLSLTLKKGVTDWLLVCALVPSKTPRKVPLKPANPPDLVAVLFKEMQETVGISTQPEKGYNDPIGLIYATKYPEKVINNALSIFRADAKYNPAVRSKIKIFTDILHREAHREGYDWIGKRCAGLKTCIKNPLNELPLETE